MSKMNGLTRKKFYQHLVQCNGEQCAFCNRTADQVQLVIDHKDNNNSNNNLENLQLLCRRCNYIKNSRRPVDMCVRERAPALLTEIEISTRNKPLFAKYLAQRVNEDGYVEEQDFIYSAASARRLSSDHKEISVC